MNTISHTMNLIKTYPSGAEKWSCADCDRQIILQWQPFKRIILSEDNPEIQHSYSKGGLRISNIEVSESMGDNLRSQLNEILANIKDR